MSIRHVVLFSFKPDTDEAVVRRIIGELNALPGIIDEIRDWSIREDLGKRDHSSRFILTAVFDTMDALNRYLPHPAHMRVVEQAIPLISKLAEHDHEV